MHSYKAPLRDMRFIWDELLGCPQTFTRLPGCEECTADIIDAILSEAARFCEEQLAPLYRSGDEEGCTLTPRGVRTPKGFADAYARYVEGGWAALSSPPSTVARACRRRSACSSRTCWAVRTGRGPCTRGCRTARRAR